MLPNEDIILIPQRIRYEFTIIIIICIRIIVSVVQDDHLQCEEMQHKVHTTQLCSTTRFHNDTDFSILPSDTQIIYLEIVETSKADQQHLLRLDNFQYFTNLTFLSIKNCKFKCFNNDSRKNGISRFLRKKQKIVIEKKDEMVIQNLQILEIRGFDNLSLSDDFLCVFANLNDLRFEEIYLTDINRIGCGINNSCCSKLKQLNLFDNSIQNISLVSFEMMTYLEILNISLNEIKTFHAFAFSSLKRLKILDLTVSDAFATIYFDENDSEGNSDKKYGLFHGLYELEQLQLSMTFFNKSLEMIKDVFFDQHRLKILDLSDNYISYLPRRVFQSQKSLKYLDLSINELTNISLQELKPLESLQFLNLAKNEIDSLDFDFSHLKELRNLTLKQNKIEHIGNSFRNCINLENIDLSFNFISSLLYKDVDGKVFKLFNSLHLPLLKTLLLKGNRILEFDYSLLPVTVEILDLSNNPMQRLTDNVNVSRASMVKMLNVSETLVTSLETSVLPPMIETLSLRNSRITNIPSKLLSDFKELIIIDITDTNIEHIERVTISNDDCNEQDRKGLYLYTENKHYQCLPGKMNRKPTIGCSMEKIIREYYFSFCDRLHSCRYIERCEERSCLVPVLSVESFMQSFKFQDCGNLNLSIVPNNILHEINELFLDGNNLVEIDLNNLLKNLTVIDVLYLNRSNIHRIKESLMSTPIKKLYLQNNYLKEFNASILKAFPSLTTLNLKNNQLKEFLVGNETLLHLADLHLEQNEIGNFEIKITKSFPLLQNLFLQNNNIREIPSEITEICRSKHLHTLHLENNKLSNISFPFNFSYSSVQIIYLQRNNLIELNSHSFGCFSQLKELHLEENNISEISKFLFLATEKLEKLFLQDNRLRSFEYRPLISNIKILDFSHNFLEQLNGIEFVKMKKLEILYLNDNKLHILSPFSFNDLRLLQEIHLQNNYIRTVERKLFQDLLSLKKLFLNNNRINEIPSNLFQYQSELEELYLQSNEISVLNGDEFVGLKNLKTLHLNNNKIDRIVHGTFVELTSLKRLALDNNSLGNYKIWNLNFSTLLEYISLKNNSFTCECDYIQDFFKWINARKLISDTTNLECSVMNKEASVKIFDKFWYENCRDKDKASLIAICSVLSSLVLLIVVFVLLYVYRLEVQIMIYTRYGVRLFYDRRIDEDKAYDAFIAYSGDDERFVVDEILPGLETYRLCLHQRDFVVGAFITDNIIAAIEQSCCTIILMSINFARSEWCRFEFKLAHQKMLQDRCRRLIIIILENFSEKDLDEELRGYFKTNTYIRWKDKLFWKRLYFALPPPRQNNQNNQANNVATDSV